MVILLRNMQTVQPQVMSFCYLNRKFFKNINIFALCGVASFRVLWEGWPCGFENHILATQSYALRELLFQNSFNRILLCRVPSWLTINLRERFQLPIRSSGRSRFSRHVGELKVPQLASLILLLDLRFEILQLYLDPIIDVSAIHVLLGKEAWFLLPLFGLVLNQPPLLLLVLHSSLVGGCSDISDLSKFELTLTDARLGHTFSQWIFFLIVVEIQLVSIADREFL